MSEVTGHKKRRESKMSATYFRAVGAVFWKDALSSMRSPEALVVMVVFSLLTLLIYQFTFGLESEVGADVGAGILWTTMAFAGVLGFYQAMAGEREQGCLDGLRLAPLDRSAVFFGKWLGGLVHLGLVASLLIPAMAIFFSLDLFNWEVAVIILLFSIGYAALGTLLATMTMQSGARELLLPVLLLAPAFPLVLAGTQSTQALVSGASWSSIQAWIRLLVACDAIFLSVAWMTYDRLLME